MTPPGRRTAPSAARVPGARSGEPSSPRLLPSMSTLSKGAPPRRLARPPAAPLLRDHHQRRTLSPIVIECQLIAHPDGSLCAANSSVSGWLGSRMIGCSGLARISIIPRDMELAAELTQDEDPPWERSAVRIDLP